MVIDKTHILKVINFIADLSLAQFFLQKLYGNHAVVFMLHRFSSEKHGTVGHDPEFVRECIRHLKKTGRNIIDVDTLIKSLKGEIAPIKNAVVFTIDDGFIEQAEVGAQIFIDEGVPVAIAVVTDFVSQNYWLAESRIAYLFETTSVGVKKINTEGFVEEIDFADKDAASDHCRSLIWYCKTLSLSRVENIISYLEEQLDVVCPEVPPLKYAALSWGLARNLQDRGVSFIPHSCRHPSLRIEPDEIAECEIFNSIEVVRERLGSVNSFLYPTGRESVDFDHREFAILRKAGVPVAFSADPGYVCQSSYLPANIISISRFSFPSCDEDFRRVVNFFDFFAENLTVMFQFVKDPLALIRNRYGSIKGFLNYVVWGAMRVSRGKGLPKNMLQAITRLVFICDGNICRSAFAEYVAIKYHVESISFGLNCPDGDPANNRAIEQGKRYGLDMEHHRTENIRSYEPKFGDLLVVMVPQQSVRVKALLGSDVPVVLLGDYTKNISPYIHDPYSCSDKFFSVCMRDIYQGVTRLVEEVVGSKRGAGG